MNTGQKIGKLIIALVWIAWLGVSVAVGLEVWLGIRWAAQEEGPSDPSPTPQFDRLLNAYKPFSAHYLHPIYVLFWVCPDFPKL